MSNTFLKGAMVLTIGGIIVKVTGALNWMILSRVMSAEGIGLYNLAYPIYLLAITVSSAGIPVAISIVTAEKLAINDFKGASRVFCLSLSVLAVSGVLMSILLYFGADWLIAERIVRDARAYESIVALAPAIFFVTMLAGFRGYFQGWQFMMPTAVSQIVEQLLRVITMLIFASMLMPRGVEYAAGGASLGAFSGAVAGFGVLLWYYFRLQKDFKAKLVHQADVAREASSAIIKRIVKLALPVSMASLMLPIVSILDSLIVPYRLEIAGYTVGQATTLFGYLQGMAVPLINMATILTASLATSIVPAVSEVAALKDKQMVFWRVAGAMRVANIITVPGFVALFLLAGQISYIFYGAPEAGLPVAILAVGIIFLGIHQVTTGVLQGLGHTGIPVINMIISAIVKVGMNWTMTAMPQLGIAGAAWATNADFAVAVVLNLYFIKRYTGFTINIPETIKIAIAGACMGVTIFLVNHAVSLYNSTIAAIAAMTLGCIVYGLVLVFTGALVEKDIRRMPVLGNKMAHAMLRLGWLKK
ncbi:MAG: polysaccharide biosynthesis protein [Pelosinus sp.]|nr:polysaccharide biosynthesis protein [Pelosinus sp.]